MMQVHGNVHVFSLLAVELGVHEVNIFLVIVACILDEAEDPASMPVFWVSKWVDYSDKYGLGYQLCDTSVGVLYNDFTRMLLGADEV